MIVELATVSTTKSNIEKHAHHLTASQANGLAGPLMVEAVAGGLITVGLWIFIARACRSGQSWARITGRLMTALEIRPAPQAVPSLAVRARDLLTSEWAKLRSVRSTYWTLLIAAIAAIGFSAIEAQTFATHPLPPNAPISSLTVSFLGLPDAVLAVGVLGVLTFSTEFTTGLIRTTFAVTPRRWAVVAAKASVAGTVTLIVLTAALLIAHRDV